MTDYFVYTAEATTPIRAVAAPAAIFTYDLRRPSLRHPSPGGVPLPRFGAYAVMSALSLFGHRDYYVATIRRGAETVHYLAATPPYYRFPFMAKNDIQIGDVTTRETARGHSLATFAVAETIRRLTAPGRRFWYLVDAVNTPSIRVAEKVGLTLSGMAIRVSRFGIGLLGFYQLVKN